MNSPSELTAPVQQQQQPSETVITPVYWMVFRKALPCTAYVTTALVEFDATAKYYFETSQAIENLSRGDHIRRVYEPIDDPKFKSARHDSWNCSNAGLIVSSEIWSLHDPKTYEMLGLENLLY